MRCSNKNIYARKVLENNVLEKPYLKMFATEISLQIKKRIKFLTKTLFLIKRAANVGLTKAELLTQKTNT